MQLAVRETVTATLVDELAAGDLDIVVASLPLGHAAFQEVAVFEDAFLLAVPRQGPYADLAVSSAADILPEALLLLEDGHCLRDQTLTVCGGIEPRRLRSSGVTSLTTILQLVAAGQGITLLPEIFLETFPIDETRIRVTRFSAPEPSRQVGIAWRRSNPRATEFGRLVTSVSDCTTRPDQASV
ncbi:LysR substrate-binding domain-containing protein [Methylobrevis pamukkalensis]|uniref:Hydrogen peroxide-inducible genes activator n=1 Tax=Methylobrevis pamukkalensis TaxID=1439726 RepID=A0A1E3GZ02_9HYPH|nr:LysR substrate-binding domain-containing protein [Methylobrevis pamukkalensis]ODN68551.1 Hydrogen peroxide-inducible genes activator [Methylobrevis pamukkalensis]